MLCYDVLLLLLHLFYRGWSCLSHHMHWVRYRKCHIMKEEEVTEIQTKMSSAYTTNYLKSLLLRQHSDTLSLCTRSSSQRESLFWRKQSIKFKKFFRISAMQINYITECSCSVEVVSGWIWVLCVFSVSFICPLRFPLYDGLYYKLFVLFRVNNSVTCHCCWIIYHLKGHCWLKKDNVIKYVTKFAIRNYILNLSLSMYCTIIKKS